MPDRVAEIAKEMAKPVKATSARRNDRYKQ